jgi:hypothetical protein
VNAARRLAVTASVDDKNASPAPKAFGLVSNSYAVPGHLVRKCAMRAAFTMNASFRMEIAMGDVVFVATALASFALLALYVCGCGRA